MANKLYFPANRSLCITSAIENAQRSLELLQELKKRYDHSIGKNESTEVRSLWAMEDKLILEQLCETTRRLVVQAGSMQGRAEYMSEGLNNEYSRSLRGMWISETP